MDPKRKKIYIILIIVCFGASAAILGWSYLGGSSSSPQPIALPVNPGPSTTNTATDTSGAFQDFSAGYTAPLVFPASTDFDTEGVSSDTFKGLADYTPVNIDNQIGRDDPFKNFPK